MSDECIQLHLRILTQPTSFTIAHMLRSMRNTYAPHGIFVDVSTEEPLDLALLTDLRVGNCSNSVTPQQIELFNEGPSAPADEIVVYFVHTLIPPSNGCATHPAGRPGAVVASGASEWTLAHEVGHILGLRHVNNSNQLMTGGGTGGITNPPPDLITSEVRKMKRSNLTKPC